MKRFINVLLAVFVILMLFGCSTPEGVTEKARVLESGANDKGSFVVVEYDRNAMEYQSLLSFWY